MIKQRIVKYNTKTGKRVGIFIAEKIYDKIAIGFSLCSKADKYDETKAIQIATNRMRQTSKGLNLPCSILSEYMLFRKKCVRYFKQDESTILPFVVYNNKLKKYTVVKQTSMDKYLDILKIDTSGFVTKKEKNAVNLYTNFLDRHGTSSNTDFVITTQQEIYKPIMKNNMDTLESIMKSEGIEFGTTCK